MQLLIAKLFTRRMCYKGAESFCKNPYNLKAKMQAATTWRWWSYSNFFIKVTFMTRENITTSTLIRNSLSTRRHEKKTRIFMRRHLSDRRHETKCCTSKEVNNVWTRKDFRLLNSSVILIMHTRLSESCQARSKKRASSPRFLTKRQLRFYVLLLLECMYSSLIYPTGPSKTVQLNYAW